MRLYRTGDLTAVGYLANLARERQSGDRTVFVRNLHINYTNICNKLCKFCSFYAAPNSQDGRGYVALACGGRGPCGRNTRKSRSEKSTWSPASTPHCPTAIIWSCCGP